MPTNSPKIEHIVQPYSKLAQIYDDVMSHVNYKRWASYVHEVIKRWHPQAKHVMDISCGTGSFLKRFARYHYIIAGFDYSYPMVHQAHLKLNKRDEQIPVWQGDISQFALRRPVDVVVCLYDSINYIMDTDHITEVMTCVHRSLKSSGLFVFDVCTERNSIKYFDNFIDRDRGRGYSYIRKSTYDHSQRIHRNEFRITFEGVDELFIERHEQRIYLLEQLLNVIDPATFELIAVLDGFTFHRASEMSIRAHFVLRKV